MQTRKRTPAREKGSGEAVQKRRASPRKRRRTDYVSMVGIEPSDHKSDCEEEEEENSEEEMLPKWVHWDVTCVTKKGVLHVKNLEKGLENCIECEGCWFSPSGFEEFGGKGSHKKWKNSIIYKNQPLQFWIDHGYLKSPPMKRRSFAASESSNPKHHLKESTDKSNHEEEVGADEQPADTSEEQTDIQNGEQTDDFALKIMKIMSQRSPQLILHRLEVSQHLQGDFHLLLNDVELLKKGSGCLPTEEQSEDLSESEAPAPTNETQEEIVSLNGDNKTVAQEEAEHMYVEDTIHCQDEEVGMLPQEEKMKDIAPNFQLKLESEEGEAIQYSELQLPTESALQKENPCTALYDPTATDLTSAEVNDADLQEIKAHTSSEVDDTDLQKLEEHTSAEVDDTDVPELKEHTSTEVDDTDVQELEEHTSTEVDDTALEKVKDACADVDNSDLQEIKDTSAGVDDADLPKVTAASAQVDDMNLEQLKMEKIKWQIKVLKLQEEYYTLQLQKLKQ